MMSVFRHLMQQRRLARNRASVDVLGPDSLLSGIVDRRAPRARIEIGRGCLLQSQLVVERDESGL